MSKRFNSTNLKAKAIIDSIPKSLTVTENCIVHYQQGQPPTTTIKTIQHCQNLKTVAPYKTELIEKSFAITIEPNSESNTPQGERQTQREKLTDFGFPQPEERTCFNTCLGAFCISLFCICVKGWDG